MIRKNQNNLFSQLIHKISFLENLSKDDLDDSKWEEKTSSFAEIKPICDTHFSAIEGVSFGDVITAEYFVFRMRFIKNIHKDMRIKFRNRIFEIKRVINENERGRVIIIIALEI